MSDALFERFLKEFLEWAAVVSFFAVLGLSAHSLWTAFVAGEALSLAVRVAYPLSLVVWIASTATQRLLFWEP